MALLNRLPNKRSGHEESRSEPTQAVVFQLHLQEKQGRGTLINIYGLMRWIFIFMRLLKKIIKASGFKQELTEAHSNLLEAVVRSSAENRRINSFSQQLPASLLCFLQYYFCVFGISIEFQCWKKWNTRKSERVFLAEMTAVGYVSSEEILYIKSESSSIYNRRVVGGC